MAVIQSSPKRFSRKFVLAGQTGREEGTGEFRLRRFCSQAQTLRSLQIHSCFDAHGFKHEHQVFVATLPEDLGA